MNRILNYNRLNKTKTQASQVNSAMSNKDSAKTNMNFAKTNMNFAKTNMNFEETNMNFANTNMNFTETNMSIEETNINTAETNTGSAKLYFRKEFTILKLLKSFFLSLWSIFYATADSYLHYSNNVIFGIAKEIPVFKKILLHISSAVYRVSGKRNAADLYDPSRQQFTYILRKEPARSFDGVIERYCGVPP